MQNSSSFDRILGILCSVLDAYSTVLFLPGRTGRGESGTLRMASSFSLGNSLAHDLPVQEGKGLVGWILKNQEPLLVSNFDQHQNYLGYYRGNEEQSIKAFMGCALDGGAGVLCVDSKRQYSFSEKDQKLLHLFAGLINHIRQESGSSAEERLAVKYYTALKTVYTLRHQYSRWADFLRYFLELMAAVTGFSYCGLYTRDPDGNSYSVEGENTPLLRKGTASGPSFPMNHGVVGWVFRNSAPVFNDGAGGAPEAPFVGNTADVAHFQAIMACPLIIQRKTRGVLCLACETPMEVNEGARDFMRMASEHLALFLENLYVKCRLRDLHQLTQAERSLADL